jgi:hypothetical protein
VKLNIGSAAKKVHNGSEMPAEGSSGHQLWQEACMFSSRNGHSITTSMPPGEQEVSAAWISALVPVNLSSVGSTNDELVSTPPHSRSLKQ